MLTRVTITGADDAVKPEDLKELSAEFPYVEWAILFSQTREGTTRYPSEAWRKHLELLAINSNMALAAHFCGQYTRDILAGNNNLYAILPRIYDRIQLNGWVYSDKLNLRAGAEWILQIRDVPLAYLSDAYDFISENSSLRISALWDVSGGKGIKSVYWPHLKHGQIGYAGGINPDNVEAVLNEINKTQRDNNVMSKPYWIDMESGVRTEDKFDLAKVRKILEITRREINV